MSEIGPDPGGPSHRVVLSLLLATLMQAFDATIVNVALPSIQRTLSIDTAAAGWVVTTYLVAASATMPVAGWLRLRFGREPLFMGAVAGFAVASVLCALAPTVAALVAARAAQGACAGVILPLTQALLLDLHPKSRHPAILARWGSTIVIGPIIGPLLGGALTEFVSWSWIFYVNVPICCLALLGVRGALRPLGQAAGVPKTKIDLVGIALLVLTVTAFELLLQNGARLGASLGWDWVVEAIVTVGGGALLLRHFDRATQPIVDIHLFHNRNFAGAVLINVVVGAIFFATITLVPSLIEGPLGHDSLIAGILMAPRGIATMAAMLVVGRLVKTLDPRPFVVLGLVVTMAALAMFAATGPGASIEWLVAASLVLGIGAGCLITPLSVLTFLTIVPEARTDAAGLYNLARQLGGALGVAGVTAVVATMTPTAPARTHAFSDLAGYYLAFFLLILLATLAIPAVSLFRIGAVARSKPAESSGGVET
ncbi:MAG TPA: DHA2 family efflux MFS transporter permease subunit [Stellaceae bacterium]|nr:DHA2 family efflux MFS transporter permease subunit [Stellaceae bacterium]